MYHDGEQGVITQLPSMNLVCGNILLNTFAYDSLQVSARMEDGKLIQYLEPKDQKGKPTQITREINGDELIMVSAMQMPVSSDQNSCCK